MVIGIFIIYFLKLASCFKILSVETGKQPAWSYSSFPDEVAHHVLEFKRNMTQCLKEVQVNDKREIIRLSPKLDSPVHNYCLIACVLKKNGIIKNGKVHKVVLLYNGQRRQRKSYNRSPSPMDNCAKIRDYFMTLITKFYSKEDKIIKKLNKDIDRCINNTIQNKDECLLASSLNQCTNNIMAGYNKRLIYI